MKVWAVSDPVVAFIHELDVYERNTHIVDYKLVAAEMLALMRTASSVAMLSYSDEDPNYEEYGALTMVKAEGETFYALSEFHADPQGMEIPCRSKGWAWRASETQYIPEYVLKKVAHLIRLYYRERRKRN